MDVHKGRQLICLCIFCLAIQSTAYGQRGVPNLTGPVVDEAGILSEATENQIVSLIQTHQDSTSNQLAVLTITSLEGDGLEEYSLRVARTWALGLADKNNGVLILVALTEQKIRVEVGYGLEGDLPDITAKQIIDIEMTPHFRQGDPDNGVLLGVQAILNAIEGSYKPASGAFIEDTFGMRLKASLILMCFPVFILGLTILRSPIVFWITTVFVSPPVFIAGFILFPPFGGFIWFVVVISCLLTIRTSLRKSQKWGPILETISKAKPGDTVPITIGNISWSYRIPKATGSSSGYSGSSGYSSSSSYSGGGGSFGGGGASGGW